MCGAGVPGRCCGPFKVRSRNDVTGCAKAVVCRVGVVSPVSDENDQQYIFKSFSFFTLLLEIMYHRVTQAFCW